ncbi:MAG: hypothetical protein QW348_02270 [Ignisphaera sp.]
MENRKRVYELVSSIETELGVSGAIVFAKGKPICPDNRCIKVFVKDLESFGKILVALAKQGISTGGLPIIVVEHEEADTIEYYILDYIDSLLVVYTTSRS